MRVTMEAGAAAPERPDPSAGGRRWWPAGVMVVSGLAQYFAVPPYGFWPLSLVGVALFVLAVRGVRWRRAARLGLVGGLSFFVPLLVWLTPVHVVAWLALAGVQALFFVPLGVGVALVARLPYAPVWIAGVWVLQELARGRFPLDGFTWGRLAFSQSDSPFTGLAAIGGAPLVSFVVAFAGALLAYGRLAWRQDRGRGVVAGFAAGAVALTVCGLVVPRASGGDEKTVAVIQGNVPQRGLNPLGQRKAVLGNHVRQMHRLAADVRAGRLERPDLVVLPENSSDIDPFGDSDAYAAIDGGVRDLGVPTLVGAVVRNAEGGPENRAIVWDPRTGPGTHYAKRHLVPFGEYMPFRSVVSLAFGDYTALVPRDLVPGTRSPVLRLGETNVGAVYCFEIAYDALVRDAAAGGEVLAVLTNNATYGGTPQPEQQLAMTRLRAVEHARPIAIAATSGISAIIDADGRILDRSTEFTADIEVRRVRAGADATLATRLGGAPEWVLAALGAGAIAVALAREIARRRGGGEDRDAAPEEGAEEAERS
ncbi:MAG: apolipoprotein N-acyltransferase [Streptosporangiales bacterium]|nr:apolipoprotein N-acyltransferase [Streptosporangiales bacterium]